MKTLALLCSWLVPLLLGSQLSAATRTWDGSASGLWNVAGNWTANVAPTNGDALVFPSGVTRLLTTNAPGGMTNLASLTFNGDGYRLFSPPLSITNGVTNSGGISSFNTVHAQVQPRASQTWQIAGRNTLVVESNIAFSALTLTLDVDGALRVNGNFFGGANANLLKLGNGRLDLNGPNNVLNQIRVSEGTLSVDGLLTANSLTISNGATLAGGGTVPAFTNSGSLRPGADFGTQPGQLTVFDSHPVAFLPGSSMQVQLQGTTPGTGHDQLRVANPPNLMHGSLTILRDAAFPLSPGQKFVIITNTGAAAISSTFTNLPQGAFITNTLPPTTVFQISYSGGDGNDVELAVVSVTITPTGTSRQWDGDGHPNLNWTNPVNWAANTLPSGGDDLAFPSSVANTRRIMNNALANGATFNRLFFGTTTLDSWSVNGNALSLIGGIVSTSTSPSFAGASLSTAVELSAPQNFAATNLDLTVFGRLGLNGHRLTLVPGTDSRISLRGSNSGPGSIVMNGNGHLFLGGSSSDAIPVTISNGTTLVSGRYTGAAAWGLTAGRLELHTGPMPGLQAAGGVFAPQIPESASGLSTVRGDLALGSAAALEIQLGTPVDKNGSPLSAVVVAGNIALNNPALTIFAPETSQVGSVFLLIDNLGANAVAGTFAGRPEGTAFLATNSFGGVLSCRISYRGGDGNDVTLAIEAPPATGLTRLWTGVGADALWETPANWSGNTPPNTGDAVEFGVNGARPANTNRSVLTLASMTWDGSNYLHAGRFALIDGLRMNALSGTNEIQVDRFITTLAPQSWHVANTNARLRVVSEGSSTSGGINAASILDGAVLTGLGPMTKTGAGTLDLENLNFGPRDGLIVDGGILRLNHILMGKESPVLLQRGRVEAFDAKVNRLIVSTGEVTLRFGPGATRTVGGLTSSSRVTLSSNTVLTIHWTNNVSAALQASQLDLAGARLDVILPPNLTPSETIRIAQYRTNQLSGIFANLPEGAVTNYGGRAWQIHYDVILATDDPDVRFITLEPPVVAPRFTSIEHLSNGDVILRGEASAGTNIQIEGSDALETFQILGSTIANSAGRFTFIDSDGAPTKRFYRAVQPTP